MCNLVQGVATRVGLQDLMGMTVSKRTQLRMQDENLDRSINHEDLRTHYSCFDAYQYLEITLIDAIIMLNYMCSNLDSITYMGIYA